MNRKTTVPVYQSRVDDIAMRWCILLTIVFAAGCHSEPDYMLPAEWEPQQAMMVWRDALLDTAGA